ncbi:MAG TPA: PP2C family protein-serine/threonine phosphatase [Candidatus Acidoferrum sp.]|nr:PP2C family protein-serine/threonine phosphatase [Candidatus Acidoferrum sp.]
MRNFWQRVSEGRQIEDLWTQFAADARASYGFYGSDVDWDEIKKLPSWRRPLHIAKQFFWALLLKLTPARRVLLLAALVMLVLNIKADTKFEFLAAVAFLLLLSLELADKVTMKRDLEIAREIQTWLVPSFPPEVPGAEIAFASRPQNSVAGDYYDAFFATAGAADGGKLTLVIADVAGKSIPAALLMATLQASLRTIAGEGASLADLVMRLNRYACAHSLDGRRFTTAVLAEYEPAARRLRYVNAGHNAPILRRANGDMEKLDVGGVPLGIQSAAAYETSAKDLNPGDALIFFTDGVVEAFDEDGAEFGDERWLAVIRALPEITAQESLQFLMTRVDAFVGVTRQSDDITCMIFRCSRPA